MATWSNVATTTTTSKTVVDGTLTIQYYEVKVGETVVGAAIRGGDDGNSYAIELGSWQRVKTAIGLSGTGGWAGTTSNATYTRHYWTGSAWSNRSASQQTLIYVWAT